MSDLRFSPSARVAHAPIAPAKDQTNESSTRPSCTGGSGSRRRRRWWQHKKPAPSSASGQDSVTPSSHCPETLGAVPDDLLPPASLPRFSPPTPWGVTHKLRTHSYLFATLISLPLCLVVTTGSMACPASPQDSRRSHSFLITGQRPTQRSQPSGRYLVAARLVHACLLHRYRLDCRRTVS